MFRGYCSVEHWRKNRGGNVDEKLRVWLEKLAVRLQGHGVPVETADLFYADGGPSRLTGKSVTRGSVKLVWGTALVPGDPTGTRKREVVLAVFDGDNEHDVLVRVRYEGDVQLDGGKVAAHQWCVWANVDLPDAFRVFERFQCEPEEMTEDEQRAWSWVDEIVTVFLHQSV